MRRNDKGIAVPGESFPLPWAVIPDHTGDYIVAANEEEVFDVSRIEQTAEFIVDAANYHERFADIVRRLAEWKTTLKGRDFIKGASELDWISDDAAALWAEYQEDLK